LEVRRQEARPARTAEIAVRWARVEMRPPRSRADDALPTVTLWAVWAHEQVPPPGVNALDWLLLTTLSVPDAAAARTVLGYYAQRWGIEIFHKVLKSGCSIERRRLAALDHMQRALYSVIAWRVLTAALVARAQPDLPCTALLDDDEWQALYCAIHQTTQPPAVPPLLADAVRWIAQLGGFLRCAAGVMARLEYGSWSGMVGGLELSPYPRRSGAITVKSGAKRGATACQMACVCGYPCRSRSGGPSPPCRTRSVTSPVSIIDRSNPSNIDVPSVHGRLFCPRSTRPLTAPVVAFVPL